MISVGVLARFEVDPGHDDEVTRFFEAGRLVVEDQPSTTGWFAFRIGPTTYGAFAIFAEDADRQALLAMGGPKLSRDNADLFAAPPSFEMLDIVAARPPATH